MVVLFCARPVSTQTCVLFTNRSINRSRSELGSPKLTRFQLPTADSKFLLYLRWIAIDYRCVHISAFITNCMIRSTCNVDRSTCNADRSTCNVDRSRFNVDRSTFNVDRSRFNADRSTLNVVQNTLNTLSVNVKFSSLQPCLSKFKS